MSDRADGEIWIGGKISAALVSNLCDLVDGLQLDEIGGVDIEAENAEQLMECVNDCGHLHLCGEDLRGGCFYDLESFLQSVGVPYIRQSSSCGAYSPEITEYLPGEHGEFTETYAADSDGYAVVRCEVVKEMLDDAHAVWDEYRRPGGVAKIEDVDLQLTTLFNNETLRGPTGHDSLPGLEIVFGTAEPAVAPPAEQQLCADVETLINSGSDEGCDGCVVVDAKAYAKLRKTVMSLTGKPCGITLD